MATDKKISELGSASAFTGVEKFELVQGGLNVAGTPEQMKTYVGAGSTREFDRAFSAELLFDKNYIEGVLHTQTAAITFTVAESGNLADQESIYGQRIVTDGVNPIYFQNFNHLANIASGDILEAGTYQFIFWFSNGLIRGSIMLPRQETVMLTPLATPTNFLAVPGTDPETEIDLSWTAVPNVSSYEIDVSTAGGGGPWTTVTAPAAAATSYTHTGRAGGTTYHYRIRAIGDQISFGNSVYAIDATTTESGADVTAPTFTFYPADLATGIAVNDVATITASEPLRDSDGVTAITDANITDYLVVKVDNGLGADIPYTATIDATKTIITITPNVVWPTLDNVFIQISGVEDVNGNESATDDATFATSDFTIMNANNLSLGNQIDSVISGADVDFELEFEFKDMVMSGSLAMTAKYAAADLQVSHVWRTNTGVNENIQFKFYRRESATGFSAREIIWNDALAGITQGKLTLKYFGAIDTNNGIDRVGLYIDDVLITAGKSLVPTEGSSSWPWDMSTGTAPFVLTGPAFREVKNLKVRNNMGATTIVDIPIIRTGTDVSGNSFDGTWT